MKKEEFQDIDEGSVGFHPETPREYFRWLYFEALDIVTSEIVQRFKKGGLRVLGEIENILIPSCNGKLRKPSKEFIDMYSGDLDFERLMPQLSMLPELIKIANKESSVQIKEISTICELMDDSSFGKVMFSETHQLLKLYLTVPMTLATAERTFSTLRRLKNYLCANMSQERLNHVILLHTQGLYRQS